MSNNPSFFLHFEVASIRSAVCTVLKQSHYRDIQCLCYFFTLIVDTHFLFLLMSSLALFIANYSVIAPESSVQCMSLMLCVHSVCTHSEGHAVWTA